MIDITFLPFNLLIFKHFSQNFVLGFLFTSQMEILEFPIFRQSSILNRWTHFVLNFHVKQQVIRLYQDGVYVYADSPKSNGEFRLSGDGRVVIGRNYTRWNCGYASVEVDELLFFNQLLPETKIRKLSLQMGSCIQ